MAAKRFPKRDAAQIDPRLKDLIATYFKTYEPPEGMTALEWALNTEEGQRAASLIDQANRQAEESLLKTPELKAFAYTFLSHAVTRELARFKPEPKKPGRKPKKWVEAALDVWFNHSNAEGLKRWAQVFSHPLVAAKLIEKQKRLPLHVNKGSARKSMRNTINEAIARKKAERGGK